MTWSWSQLVKASGGDEEKALYALSELEGWGAYRDDVHAPMKRVNMLSDRARSRERQRKRRAAARLRAQAVEGS